MSKTQDSEQITELRARLRVEEANTLKANQSVISLRDELANAEATLTKVKQMLKEHLEQRRRTAHAAQQLEQCHTQEAQLGKQIEDQSTKVAERRQKAENLTRQIEATRAKQTELVQLLSAELMATLQEYNYLLELGAKTQGFITRAQLLINEGEFSVEEEAGELGPLHGMTEILQKHLDACDSAAHI
jgi:uncharacterized protein involved in exopolysaccharide biosynthesis